MIVKYFTDIMTSKDTNNLASPRLLETLNNLCFAVARLKQKEIIDVDDVKEVTAFYGVQLKSLCMTIEEGLDFIERPLTSPIYPRRISTRTTKDGQILVKNREQALARFQQSNLLDCRISAYPFPVPEYKGLNRQPPNFLLSDLDQKDFNTKKSFQKSMQNTLASFKDKLHGANPTAIWSGGGYHFLQPLDIVLEEESVFMEFTEPSRKLMHYTEKLVTNNKADSSHSNTVSFGNCMIRIPGSYNSKYVKFSEEDRIVNIPPKVRIIQRWDGYRPNIRWLLKDYWIYLIQERNNEALSRLQEERSRLTY